MRLAVTAITIAALATGATAKSSDRMTLAEARRLPASGLAKRLINATDAAAYVEADVQGDGGLMIHQPGLNAIDLYRAPRPSGFDRICEIDGMHFEFETSRYDTPGDPPHRVRDKSSFTRFAMLAPGGRDQDCAGLAPVVGRTDPRLFAVRSDRAADAFLAMRVIARAQTEAALLGPALTCQADAKDQAICADPAAAITAVPIRQIHFVEIAKCPDAPGQCVHAIWQKAALGKDARMVELDIRTDNAPTAPDADFNVVAAKIRSGVWIFD
jgi:hypothetical protein